MAHSKPGPPDWHLARMHGHPPHVQGLHRGGPESPQHCLLECPLAQRALEAFYYIWQKWGTSNDVTLCWPFVMLGETVFERKDDPPRSKGLDCLNCFVVFGMWT
jgi:hypothetical protein